MKAYFLQTAGDKMNLELREVPTPQPAAHQHLVKIHASSLNRGELIAGHGLIAAGAAKPAGQEAAGVGVAALQAARAIGAKVIGTSGSAEKLQKLKTLGLDVAIQTRKPDFQDAVLKATGGKGVDLVVNNVGGSVFAECIRAAAFQGRLATVGYLDRGMKAELDIDALHPKRLKLFGVSNKHPHPQQPP